MARLPNQLIDGAITTFEALNLRVYRQWIVACHQSFTQTRTLTLEDFVEKCFAQSLYSDLTYIVQYPALPHNIHEWTRKVLAGQFILQIQACEVVTDPSASAKHRICKFVLTDGCTNVVAIELQRIDGLNEKTCVGQKLAVRDVTVRHGILMLDIGNTVALGGACDVSFDKIATTADDNQANAARRHVESISDDSLFVDSPAIPHRANTVGPVCEKSIHLDSHSDRTMPVANGSSSTYHSVDRNQSDLNDYGSLPMLEPATQIPAPQPSQRILSSSLQLNHQPLPSDLSPNIPRVPVNNDMPSSPQFVDEFDMDDINDVSQERLSSFYDEPIVNNHDDLDFDLTPPSVVKSENSSSQQSKKPPVSNHASSQSPGASSNLVQFAPAHQFVVPHTMNIRPTTGPPPPSSVTRSHSIVSVAIPSVNNMCTSQPVTSPSSQSSTSSGLNAPTPPVTSQSSASSLPGRSTLISPRQDPIRSDAFSSTSISRSVGRPSLFSSSRNKQHTLAPKPSHESRPVSGSIDDVFDLPGTQDMTMYDDQMELDSVVEDATKTDALQSAAYYEDDVFGLQSPPSTPPIDTGSPGHLMVDEADDQLEDVEEMVYEDFDQDALDAPAQSSLSGRVARISELHQSRPGLYSAGHSANSVHAKENTPIAMQTESSFLVQPVVGDTSLDDLPPLESATLDPVDMPQLTPPIAVQQTTCDSTLGLQSQASQSQSHPVTSLRRFLPSSSDDHKEVFLIDSDDDESLKQEPVQFPAQSAALDAFAAAVLHPSNVRPFCFLADLSVLSRSPLMNVPKVLSVKAFILSSVSFRYSPRFELVVWVDDGTAVCRMQVSSELLERDAWHCSANELQANKKLFEERRGNAERFLARMEGVMTIRLSPGRVIDGGECTGRVICQSDPVILSVAGPNTQSALAMRQTAMARAKTCFL